LVRTSGTFSTGVFSPLLRDQPHGPDLLRDQHSSIGQEGNAPRQFERGHRRHGERQVRFGFHVARVDLGLRRGRHQSEEQRRVHKYLHECLPREPSDNQQYAIPHSERLQSETHCLVRRDCDCHHQCTAAQAQRGPVVPQMRGDGPPPQARSFSITKNDPALDDIISSNATLVELARGFGLTEGGLWIEEGNTGYWIFAGLLDNVLYKVTPRKQVSVFMEKAGYTGSDPSMSAPRRVRVAVMCCSLVRRARGWIIRGA
jgi:hypothetical protein